MKVINRSYFNRIILSFVLVISHAVQADEVPKIASARIHIDTSELNQLWFDALKLLNAGEWHDANLKLKELDLKKIKLGLTNLPDQSVVVIKYADTLKKQKNLAEAVNLLESAKQLSPDFAGVYFALAKLRFAEKASDLYGVGRYFLYGVVLTFKDINTIVTYANNGLAFLLLSCSITGAVFILFSFAYYRRAIFYSLKELSPLPLPLFIANILGWVVVGVVTIVCGIFWGILFLAALLLIPQIEPVSKRVLQIVLLCGSLLAVLLIAVSITFTAFNGDYFQALRSIYYGNYSTRTVTALQKRLHDHPDDAYAMFGLAYITANMGNFQEAIDTYTLIESSYPDRAAIQNNLGNLYHLQFRTLRKQKPRDQKTREEKAKEEALYHKAQDAYHSAIGYSLKMFEPRYNIAQLLLVDFADNEDTKEQIEAARRFGRERFTRYSRYLEEGIFTVNAPLSASVLLQKLYDQEARDAGLDLAKNLWASGSRFRNPWYFSIASFGLLVLSSLFDPKKEGGKKKSVNYCQMCGDPYTMMRKKSEAQQNLCTQCTYIFKKKTTVKSEKRAEKVKQIQLRQKIRDFIAKAGSICFPGAGQIYFGYIIKGILLSFVFSLALLIVLLKIYTRTLLERGGSSGASLITLSITALVLLGTYIFNIYDIRKLSPKNQ